MGFSYFAPPLSIKLKFSPTYSANFLFPYQMAVGNVSKQRNEKLVGKIGSVRKCYSAYRTEFVRNRKNLLPTGHRLSGIDRFLVDKQPIIGK
jgi:hypothetical protein